MLSKKLQLSYNDLTYLIVSVRNYEMEGQALAVD
jgi:hypothetical protein